MRKIEIDSTEIDLILNKSSQRSNKVFLGMLEGKSLREIEDEINDENVDRRHLNFDLSRLSKLISKKHSAIEEFINFNYPIYDIRKIVTNQKWKHLVSRVIVNISKNYVEIEGDYIIRKDFKGVGQEILPDCFKNLKTPVSIDALAESLKVSSIELEEIIEKAYSDKIFCFNGYIISVHRYFTDIFRGAFKVANSSMTELIEGLFSNKPIREFLHSKGVFTALDFNEQVERFLDQKDNLKYKKLFVKRDGMYEIKIKITDEPIKELLKECLKIVNKVNTIGVNTEYIYDNIKENKDVVKDVKSLNNILLSSSYFSVAKGVGRSNIVLTSSQREETTHIVSGAAIIEKVLKQSENGLTKKEIKNEVYKLGRTMSLEYISVEIGKMDNIKQERVSIYNEEIERNVPSMVYSSI